ncbi:MAG: ATP-binding protein [Bacteroidota bacterium]
MKPAFYQTWWFKLLATVSVLSMLLLTIRYYFLNRQRHELAEKVAEKTKTLNEKVTVLNRINHDLEQYAYAASHDLKTPLRNVITHLQLFERNFGEGLETDAREYIDLAIGSAKEMHVMIDDLLTYAKVGQVENWEIFSVDEVLAEVKHILDRDLEEKNGIIHAHRLPEVKGVKLHWRLLFQNLLHNGLKFNRSQQPEIHIAFRDSLDFWIFSVSDNGIGIDPEYALNIFDLFHRLDKIGFQGTGLGLAICKKIINMHGGHIWVESRPGEGATFLFSIPKDPEKARLSQLSGEL